MIVNRGEFARFRAAFFLDASWSIPAVPLDPQAYPAFVIKDFNNQAVYSGVGTADASAGYWIAEWFVPKEASLSNDGRRWRIEWWFVTSEGNRQLNHTQEFDLRDTVVTADVSREIKKLALDRKPFVATLRRTVRPHRITASLMQGDSVFFGPVLQTAMDIAQEGDSYVFAMKIPENVLQVNMDSRQYTVLWEIQDTPTSYIAYEYQNLNVIPVSSLQNLSSLRMLIDKFQKRLGRLQAYEDSDLWEYLVQGHTYLNAWYPTTSYPLNMVPQQLNNFWIFAAGWYALNAQHLLEIDLAFSFSGQTVTLDYDHTSGLDSAISRFADHLTNHLTPAKMALLRATQSVGSFSGRPTRLRMYNLVYPIQSAKSQDLISIISNLGLL